MHEFVLGYEVGASALVQQVYVQSSRRLRIRSEMHVHLLDYVAGSHLCDQAHQILNTQCEAMHLSLRRHLQLWNRHLSSG